jgi:hypothetical protein
MTPRVIWEGDGMRIVLRSSDAVVEEKQQDAMGNVAWRSFITINTAKQKTWRAEHADNFEYILARVLKSFDAPLPAAS